MTGPAQVAWCPLCRRGEYCPDNERLAMLESQKDLAAQLERADQWQTEACQLRARIAELEGRVESLIREHLEHEKEINEMWHNRLIEEAALKLNERARAEKAEAERDELRQLHRHALDSMDQVFQSCDEIPHPLLPDFCRVGEDKFRAVIRLANSYISLRAERDRYLAAIVEAERLAMKGVRDIDDGTWISDIAILLRPIVEEASRG